MLTEKIYLMINSGITIVGLSSNFLQLPVPFCPIQQQKLFQRLQILSLV